MPAFAGIDVNPSSKRDLLPGLLRRLSTDKVQKPQDRQSLPLPPQ